MKFSIQLFCVSVILIATGIAQEPEQLKKLRFGFEVVIAEKRKPLTEFEKQYRVQLQKLKERTQAAGELKKLIAVKEELKSYGSGDTKGFPDLERLQGIYKKEKKAIRRKCSEAEKPVIVAYQKKLNELQRKLTQEGNIEGALSVAAAIEKLKLSGIAVAAPSKLVMKDGSSTIASATKEKPFENSLGMKFVPVRITRGPTKGNPIFFSIWETRVRDYSVFVTSTNRKWGKPSFDQGDDHPAVLLSGTDASEFCKWLTVEERKKQKIGQSDRYRLPSDYEWSYVVGIGRFEDPKTDPFEKNSKIADVYPWGNKFPPPNRFGNYLGEETKDNLVAGRQPIKGFSDGFRNTAPVGSFAPSKFGLYDMGGNVCEWCDDSSDPKKKQPVIFRDGSWRHHVPTHLLSSKRWRGVLYDHIGFRCVLEIDADKEQGK